MHVLSEDNLISLTIAAVITTQHVQLAEKTRDIIVDMLLSVDELISSDEIYVTPMNEEVENFESDCEPDEKKLKVDLDHVPLEYNIMVVNLAKKHPKWNFKSLQSKRAHRLK